MKESLFGAQRMVTTNRFPFLPWRLWKAALAVPFLTFALSAANFPDPAVDTPHAPGKSETAVLAGGCFWGIEGVFESLKGVSKAVSGYAGGKADTAHYEIVSTGKTGHAESVRITYDPSVISYGQLLKVYFSVAHDPTELNRQGPDSGTQYRSEIFYTNEEQKKVAEAYIQQLDQAKIYHKPIVTKLEPLQKFYPAEEHHQHFMARNPDNPYIVYNDAPKVSNLHKQFPELVKGDKK
jgi:peptide-methionine (S)-S-oxide reductase